MPVSVEDDMAEFVRKAGKLRNRNGNMHEEDEGWQTKANVLIASFGLPTASVPWKLPIKMCLS